MLLADDAVRGCPGGFGACRSTLISPNPGSSVSFPPSNGSSLCITLGATADLLVGRGGGGGGGGGGIAASEEWTANGVGDACLSSELSPSTGVRSESVLTFETD